MSNRKKIRALVKDVRPLTDSILRVLLEPEEFMPYEAGQYLQLETSEGLLAYSIANAPLGGACYELHIRHTGDDPFLREPCKTLSSHQEVGVLLPFGQCHVKRLLAYKRIIYIAGGTGFAPVKAMLEYAFATGDPRNCSLYWSAKKKSDLYWEPIQHWSEHTEHFHYIPMLLATPRVDAVLAAVLKTVKKINLRDTAVVLAGPFDMVYKMRDGLLQAGFLSEHVFSDAFEFETKKG